MHTHFLFPFVTAKIIRIIKLWAKISPFYFQLRLATCYAFSKKQLILLQEGVWVVVIIVHHFGFGNIVHGVKAGNRELKLYNAGKCEAKEVKVEWLNPSEEVLLMHDFSTIGDLTPQNGRTFHMAICMGAPDTMNLRYSWKDEFSDNNVYEEKIQL